MTIHTLTPAVAALDRVRLHNLSWIGYFPKMDCNDPTKGFKLLRDYTKQRWCVIEFALSDWHHRSSWTLKAFIERHGWLSIKDVPWLRVWYPEQLVKLGPDERPSKPGIYITSTSRYNGQPDRILDLYKVSEMDDEQSTVHAVLAKKAFRTATALGVTVNPGANQAQYMAAARIIAKNSSYSSEITETDILYAAEGQPVHVNGNSKQIWLFYVFAWLKLKALAMRTHEFDIERVLAAIAGYHDAGSFVLLPYVTELCQLDTKLMGKLCNIINGHLLNHVGFGSRQAYGRAYRQR